MRGSTSAHWFLPLDSISYEGLGAALEDDAEKLYVSAAAFLSRHRTVTYGATVNLTRLREITQDLAELFGLTLPSRFTQQIHKKTG